MRNLVNTNTDFSEFTFVSGAELADQPYELSKAMCKDAKFLFGIESEEENCGGFIFEKIETPSLQTVAA